jgi:triphosphoribosyl-dephospho-CoA synthase
MLGLYLDLLARAPDSHIARRHGDAVAHTVMGQTLIRRNAWIQSGCDEHDAGLAQWDLRLKQAGWNPGTTADLCVACATVAAWLDPSLVAPSEHDVGSGKPAVTVEPSERPDPFGHGS